MKGREGGREEGREGGRNNLMLKFYLVYILIDVALLFCPVTCCTDIILLAYTVY